MPNTYSPRGSTAYAVVWASHQEHTILTGRAPQHRTRGRPPAEISSKEDDNRRFQADASAAGNRSETGPIVDWREGRLRLKEETVR
jgi:hypothetical protein